MTLTVWIRLLAGVVVLAVFTAIGAAWRAEMRSRAELAADLAATKSALEAADARQRDRDARLADTLAAIAKEKRTVRSPAQIVTDLPLQMHLPAAISLQSVPGAQVTVFKGMAGQPRETDTRSAGAEARNVQAVIPGEDLKPIYDFALDCKACRATLAASQSDLADEQGKTKVLIKERDNALRVARGGSVLRRIARASKWMLIGAAAGAVAARAAH